jgi:SAM-dependent methyltransferase
LALDETQKMKPKGHTWPQYLRNGLGLKLSKVGETLGIDAFTYNPVILELFHSMALQNAPKVVASLREVFPTVKSVIDVGCGGGAFAAEFQSQGVRSIGLEHSPHGVALARKQGVDCRAFDVAGPVSNQITDVGDLVYSFEVAEHVPATLADRFVHFMTRLGPLVVFAAAQPNQGGIGHINEQPLSYWIEKFERQGFRLSTEETEALRAGFRQRGTSDWFFNNTCVFRGSINRE